MNFHQSKISPKNTGLVIPSGRRSPGVLFRKRILLLCAFNAKCCIAACLVLFLSSCNGQTKRQETESKALAGASEIPKGMVYCGFLDREDNLWFGTTTNGVYKFDGLRCTHYSEEKGLSGSRVTCIAQAKNGDLWFGTPNGISVFNGTEFSHLKIPEYKISTDWLRKSYPAVNPNEVQAILQDKAGNFWIGTNGAGVYFYDGKTFTHHLSEIGDKMPDGRYHNIVQSIAEDHDGNIWFASMSHGGATKYDGKNFIQYLPENGLSDDQVRTIYVDSKGVVWFGFNGNRNSGLTYFNGQTFHTLSVQDGLCSKNIMAICEDHLGRIWAGGMQGLCHYDGTSFTNLPDERGWSSGRIIFIIQDAAQNVWFGGDGLWKYNGEQIVTLTGLSTQ